MSKIAVLHQFYQRYFDALCGRGGQRMALLLQVTQWHIEELSEEEYLHWL